MIQALLPAILALVGKAVDKAVPDKDKAEKLKHVLSINVMTLADTELKSAAKVIMAEARGESWLQRNWRPLVMIWFSILVGAHWFGFTPPNLSEDQVIGLFKIVQYGLSGYVVGRSAEKITRNYFESKGKE